MDRILKRRMRRPYSIPKGQIRVTPNFYPQFYDDGGSLDRRDRFFTTVVPTKRSRYYELGGSMPDNRSPLLSDQEKADYQKVKKILEPEVKKILEPVTHGVFLGDREPAENKKKPFDTSDAGSKIGGILGAAGSIAQTTMDLAHTADMSSVEEAIDETANRDYTNNTSTSSLLSAYNSNAPMRTDYSYDEVRGVTDGGKVMGILDATAQGAAGGMAFGPWGAAIGAGVGAIASTAGMLAGNSNARRKVKSLNASAQAANQSNLASYNQANEQLMRKSNLSQLSNLAAYGGNLKAMGGPEDDNLFHKQFPSFAQNGKMNKAVDYLYKAGTERGMSLDTIAALASAFFHEFNDSTDMVAPTLHKVYLTDNAGNYVLDDKGDKIWTGKMERTIGPFQYSQTYPVDPMTMQQNGPANNDNTYDAFVKYLSDNGISIYDSDWADKALETYVDSYLDWYIPWKFEEYRKTKDATVSNGNYKYDNSRGDMEELWNNKNVKIDDLTHVVNQVFQRSSSKDKEDYNDENVKWADLLKYYYTLANGEQQQSASAPAQYYVTPEAANAQQDEQPSIYVGWGKVPFPQQTQPQGRLMQFTDKRNQHPYGGLLLKY